MGLTFKICLLNIVSSVANSMNAVPEMASISIKDL